MLSPELVQVNRLPARATFTAFPDAETARTAEREASPWFLSLDGEWQAHLARTPRAAFDWLRQEEATREAARPIRVPGHWQLQGFWDRPHYTNIEMPFDLEAPHVPEQNPTCVYRRAFAVPAEWRGLRVVLHFGGADNTLVVYLNGKFVGLSKDSRSPAEFDVTSHVRSDGADNDLVAVVIKWSGTSWIEDQDHWWLSGLHREVFVCATRPIYLADVQVRAGLADDYRTGTLEVFVPISFPGLAEPCCRVEAQLYDPAGKAVLRRALTGEIDASRKSYQRWPGPAARLVTTLPRVKAWCAEQPHLYTLVVTLATPAGTESTSVQVGFRRVEIRDRALLVNGRRVLIKGVNRHDHDDEGGKAVPREQMLQDVLTMKRFNVNAVRTSHYPNDPYFLDLCDRHGLYVLDEANIEAHAEHNLICRDPRFAPAFLDHMMNMVGRDRNHPCVYAWSLGNESGYGPNHDLIAAWTRRADPTRPLHYEGAISRVQSKFHWDTDPKRPVTWDDGRAVTDFVCPMHMSLDEMVTWRKESRDPRPMIVCEFSHAMGNGNGCLGEFYDAFQNTPGLQGGFIWQWIDHGLKQRAADGTEYWAYGGDFGDGPNDANFLCGGLVWPDRTPHSGLYELKRLAQPVGIEAADARARGLRITNKQDFTTLAWLLGTWTLEVNGVVQQSGKLPTLRTPPGASEVVRLPYHRPVAQPDDECFLTIRFAARAATPWCDAGHEVAAGQAAVPMTRRRAGARRRERGAVVEHSGDAVVVRVHAGELEAALSRAEGTFTSLRCAGRELLQVGPRLNVWRAPVDNDGIKAWSGQEHKPLGRWLKAGLNDLRRTLKTFSVQPAAGGKVAAEIVHWVAAAAGGIEHRETLTFAPDGSVLCQHVVTVDETLPDLPRLGVSLALSPNLTCLTWFGRGPHESYPDRKRGALVSRYESTVAQQYVPYIVPQDHGNHSDTRWFTLTDAAGVGLRFEAVNGELFEFSASHYHPDDLFRAAHTHEIQPRPEVLVTIDHRQRGLGSASCGPDTLPEYQIPPGTYRFAFRVRPLLP